MPQTVCTLGTVSFPYNAYPYTQPPVKSTVYVPTLGGGYNTIWGVFLTDQVITMSWDVIDRAFYNQLLTLFNTLGTLPFVDPYGTHYTVLFTDLTPTSLLKGGDDALETVTVKLRLISSP